MKKVTFIFSDFGGRGSERIMTGIANALAQSGVAVDILVFKKEGPFLKEVDDAVTITELGAHRMLRTLPKLIAYLYKERPTSVVATNIHMQVLLLLARRFVIGPARGVIRIGTPLSYRLKTMTSRKDKFAARMVKMLFKKAFLVANSRGVAEDAAKTLGISPDQLTVIYNPIDIVRIKERASAPVNHPWLSGASSHKTIVAAGQLRGQKNFALLIEAVARMSLDVRIIFLGSGNELDMLRKRARERGIGAKVDFLGFVENPFIYSARADAVVLTSLYEGFPNTLLEAMACGTPVIATDCSYGPRELLAPDTDHTTCMRSGVEEGAYGILVPQEAPQELCDALTRLFEDQELSKRYREKGVKRAQDFRTETIMPQYRKVLLGEDESNAL